MKTVFRWLGLGLLGLAAAAVSAVGFVIGLLALFLLVLSAALIVASFLSVAWGFGCKFKPVSPRSKRSWAKVQRTLPAGSAAN